MRGCITETEQDIHGGGDSAERNGGHGSRDLQGGRDTKLRIASARGYLAGYLVGKTRPANGVQINSAKLPTPPSFPNSRNY